MISLQAPSTCPSCGSETVFDPPTTRNESVDGGHVSGQALRCGGPPLLCQPRAVQALQHAFSRDALDVQGLSEARIRQLMNESMLTLPSDVFVLAKDATKLEELSKLPGWGTKSAEAFATAANRVVSGGVTLARLIYSLGIRGVGVHLSSLIAARYAGVADFLDDMRAAAKASGGDESVQSFARLREDNEMTRGIGPTAISALEAFARERSLMNAALALVDQLHIIDDSPASASSTSSNSNGPFQGMTVVFTGALPGMSRSQVQQLAKTMGATSTPSAVSRSTDLVVAGAKEGGKKMRDAALYGVRIMSVEEFLSLASPYGELP
jgi:DNA ligase (NAD+)